MSAWVIIWLMIAMVLLIILNTEDKTVRIAPEPKRSEPKTPEPED